MYVDDCVKGTNLTFGENNRDPAALVQIIQAAHAAAAGRQLKDCC